MGLKEGGRRRAHRSSLHAGRQERKIGKQTGSYEHLQGRTLMARQAVLMADKLGHVYALATAMVARTETISFMVGRERGEINA
jgi:hypothetical protein